MSDIFVDPGPSSVRVLTEVGRALTNAADLPQVARLTTRGAVDLLRTRAALLVLTDAAGHLSVLGASGVPQERIEAGKWQDDQALDGWLLDLFGTSTEGKPDNILAVPLVAKQAVIGFLAAAPVPLKGRDRADWLLSALADHAAVSIDSLHTADLHNQALRTMSHDVRTPLQTIRWCTNLLATGDLGPLNETQRQVIARLETSIRHVGALVTNMLDMAALETNRFELARAPFDLGQTAADAIDIVRPEAAGKGHFIESVLEPSVLVIGDPDRLRQVAINLLHNAIKYCPEGCRVGVDVHRVDHGQARLSVWDEGPGIAVDELDKIFEPYYRARAAHDGPAPGVGLGLAICRRLTHMMGGHLWVESTRPGGSRFSIDLPRSMD